MSVELKPYHPNSEMNSCRMVYLHAFPNSPHRPFPQSSQVVDFRGNSARPLSCTPDHADASAPLPLMEAEVVRSDTSSWCVLVRGWIVAERRPWLSIHRE